jgi:hypothetical protein
MRQDSCPAIFVSTAALKRLQKYKLSDQREIAFQNSLEKKVFAIALQFRPTEFCI